MKHITCSLIAGLSFFCIAVQAVTSFARLKKLPLGTQTFSKIIQDSCIYVDKTEHIYSLIQGNCYFFSRPRRFGKSLLCSTLKEIFLGKKELFKGLWIDQQSDFAWNVHPVIHIDFLLIAHKTPEELTASIMRHLNDIAEQYSVGPLTYTTPGEMLKKLVINLLKKYGDVYKVVLIIDEYDKPILEHIDDIAVAHEMRDILKVFYEYIKGLDEHLRFVFITGVTRFSKTSIFSGLNQLVDISMDSRYAHLVGYTETEMYHYFEPYIEKTAYNQNISIDELKKRIRTWYNGYKFWKDQPLGLRLLSNTEPARLYTPISILKCFDTSLFENYWFESATPTVLLSIIAKNDYPLESFDCLEASMQELAHFDPEHISLVTLLFQTGYITIKAYNEAKENYIFEIPNQEVRESLLKYILAFMTKYKHSEINDTLKNLKDSLINNEIDAFIAHMKQFYAYIPYSISIEKEKYYQTIFYVILRLIGLHAEAEKATNIGRIDMLLETDSSIYIFEFKLNDSAKNALEQIYTTRYYEPYLEKNKKIVAIGINFSSKQRNIADYVYETCAIRK